MELQKMNFKKFIRIGEDRRRLKEELEKCSELCDNVAHLIPTVLTRSVLDVMVTFNTALENIAHQAEYEEREMCDQLLKEEQDG